MTTKINMTMNTEQGIRLSVSEWQGDKGAWLHLMQAGWSNGIYLSRSETNLLITALKATLNLNKEDDNA
jgi:hypothetical protein